MKIFITILIFCTAIYANITNYKPIKACVELNSNLYYAIRSFDINNKLYYLVVNPDRIKTYIVNINKTTQIKCPTTPNNYTILRDFNNPKHPLQNDGITTPKNGIFLTTDLCPSSKKGFERRLYESLIKNFKNPVPVTLFITKRWILKHRQEFIQLKTWQKEGKLDITWGNHTAKHIYHPKLPLKENFVLSKEENMQSDILELEKYLLKNGVVPSVFFRFPGLVSNKKVAKKVKELGLITIGSNAWLAKGQMPKNGSIILVHGNKNEPKGVDIFLKLIYNHKINSLKSIKDLNYQKIK
jgi:peptidoglycan/xylan/chitin deacetylase (PgdA/CDA1 family)